MASAVPVPVPPADGFTVGEYSSMDLGYRWTELIDGRIVVNPSPRPWHGLLVRRLATAMGASAPRDYVVLIEQDVRLNDNTAPAPDIVVVQARTFDDERVAQPCEEVVLVVEVWSPGNPNSERVLKPKRYAEAGIQYFWSVERENGLPFVRTYELNTSSQYVETGGYRNQLTVVSPWQFEVDLQPLVALHD